MTKIMKKLLHSLGWLLILISSAKLSYGLALPENHSVNGGLTIIPIDFNQKPEAYFEGKRIPVLPSTQPRQWLLIVAIPLKNTNSVQYINVTKPIKASIPFHVSQKFYSTQFLNIKDISKVAPQPEDLIRIEKETKKLTQIFANYSNTNPFEKQFTAPLRGPITSLFGLKRVYNKQPRDPHSGLDIAADEGKPVYAVNQGVVADTGDYFFTGNTVILDHGMGVFSVYAHLSKILVKTGETVKQGQELGLVGMTGRVTGPHLHWTMVVNQTLVEPLLFVPFRKITVTPVMPDKKSNKSTQDTTVKS
ncbi:M23 family metallopeptidase [Legionella pneumophila]|nr:M23 family metallopeptidase [Legionella pneumophila]HAT9854303.1 peptidoglycan DD-metalloendopeptidase family protein [Legionella pneumophila subsp. pneumophila]HAT8672307.1 peptidoglycan DD-metalloendopeptidase family protein [Legionella pneumophila]HAU1020139.1 M23 family metallopeptidase [Legionella pneumophila]HAU1057599.1 M23 family metallopeptidase [Legionella pneumophila]